MKGTEQTKGKRNTTIRYALHTEGKYDIGRETQGHLWNWTEWLWHGHSMSLSLALDEERTEGWGGINEQSNKQYCDHWDMIIRLLLCIVLFLFLEQTNKTQTASRKKRSEGTGLKRDRAFCLSFVVVVVVMVGVSSTRNEWFDNAWWHGMSALRIYLFIYTGSELTNQPTNNDGSHKTTNQTKTKTY